MTTLAVLSPADVAGVLQACAEVLADHAAALDLLEHVPTDDGTAAPAGGAGTSLAGALASAAAAAAGASDLTRLGDAVAAACAGSPGRAGRTVAAMSAGWADALRNADRVDGPRLALMLEAGAEALTGGDDGAHPGGPAAVAAAAADAALGAADTGASLAEVVLAAADGGLAELERGPVVDPALARRGVVDAVAAGFLLVLDVLASTVTGEPLPELPSDPFPAAPADGGHRTTTQYEVRCRLSPAEGVDPDDWLRDALAELGEVRVLEPGNGAWAVEVRTPLPGAVVEALVDAGRPREMHIAVVVAAPDGAVDGG